jgi:hypothetical protein
MDFSVQLDNLSSGNEGRLAKKAQTSPQTREHNAPPNSEVAHILPISEADDFSSTSMPDFHEIDPKDLVLRTSPASRIRHAMNHFWLAEFVGWVYCVGCRRCSRGFVIQI